MRFKYYLCLYFLLSQTLLLQAYNPEDHFKDPNSPENRIMLTNLNAEPSCMAAGCVNVISGSFSDHEVDLVIQAPEPFIFARSYSSSDTSLGVIRGGCHSNHEGRVIMDTHEGNHHYKIKVGYKGPYGTRNFYEDHNLDLKKTFIALNPLPSTLRKGVTNAFQGFISAHTDPSKIRFEFDRTKNHACGIRMGSNEMHQFERLPGKSHDQRLVSVSRPSGCSFKYSYDPDGKLSWCIMYNRAGIDIGHFRIVRENNKITVIPPSDERKVEYSFTNQEEDFPVLTSVRRSDGPDVTYKVEEKDYKTSGSNILGHRTRIIKKEFPKERCLEIDYYKEGSNILGRFDIQIHELTSPLLNRVKTLKAPVGANATPIITHSFNYDLNPDRRIPNSTAVIDAYNNHTFYYYNGNDRLISVKKCFQETAYTEETLDWSSCYLTGRKFGRSGAPPTYQVKYHYDENHNIVEEETIGNITGFGEQTKCKKCTYSKDHFHLLTSIQEGNLRKEFGYLPDTNLLKECFYCDEKGSVLLRYFYEYDDNGMVTKMITDDGNTKDQNNLQGITQRKVEETKRRYYYPAGLPEEVKTSYLDIPSKALITVRYDQNEFDARGRLIHTVVRDGNYQFLKEQRWAYNAYGNLTEEQNSLGDIITRSYDENGNLTKEVGPLPNFFKTFKYDYSNRLIQIDEHHLDGVFSQIFSYSYLGHRTQSVDPFGNVTNYEHDCFGRLLKEIGPPIDNVRPKTVYEYNELSCPISITDPNGNTTRSSYTIFGKPCKIEYPDGSIESTEYNLESQAIRHTAKNGTFTIYTRDPFGRIVKTEVFDPAGKPLSQTQCLYNSYHLLSETDPAGHVTKHTYDFRGRKISTAKENQIIQFEYDELDRINKTIRGDCISAVKYDALDRIIEEWEEDSQGNLLKKTCYEYDSVGRKIRIDQGEGRIIRNTYDTHGVLVKTIDPEGHVTMTETSYRPLIISSTTDPKGVKTVTYFNAQGKAYQTKMFDPFSLLLHATTTKYDLNGNKIEIQDHPYAGGKALSVQIQKFEYDSLNRLTHSIQAAGSFLEKRSSIYYNKAGQKATVVKPDGISIHHTYDFLGRLDEYYSSDHSFHYHYTYDPNSNPISANDRVCHTQTVRKYNSYDQMTSEKLQNGLTIAQNYTTEGQLTSCILPDQSSIRYTYQSYLVKSAERLDPKGKSQYIHTFDAYDLLGQITLESLLNHIGTMQRVYTPSGHLQSAISPFFSEIMPQDAYDQSGNLLARTIKNSSSEYEEHFTYDHLDQLSAENGVASHAYTYDSMHNRLLSDGKAYTHNLLNQMLSDEENEYSYDLAGNLLHIRSSKENRSFQYDALDRLVKVVCSDKIIEYTYDEMNRCLSRSCQDAPELRFFYLNQIEMGACSAEGAIVQFQLLGPGHKTEPCRAVAIELDGTPYAPCHDQSGHIRCLINGEGSVVATYQYSAFGPACAESSLNNPWTFAGKRTDPDTGYVLFGRRFYAPCMGRWLTQDPAGYDAGPNLYAYLLNSPLAHYDAFGLFEFTFDNTMGHIGWMIGECVSHAINLAKGTSGMTGCIIHTLAWNAIPIPVIKDIPMAVGYFLQHGTFKGYTLSYREPHSQILQAGSGSDEGVSRIAMCGMGNDLKTAQKYTDDTSKAHGGKLVWGIYGASHGVVSDLIEVGLQAVGIRTHQVQVAEKAIALHKGAKWTSIEAHSRGGRTVDLATRAFSSEVQKTFWVTTYGSAKIIDGGRFASATNYISTWDFIPLLGDPFGYAPARLFGNPYVEFLQPLEYGFEHSIGNDTYSNAMEKNALDFNTFLRRSR